MTSKNAVEWHTEIATEFDAGYGRSENFKERFNVFSKLIKKYSGSEKTVIDLGCGAGIFSVLSASMNHSVTGIDASTAMIALGNRKIESEHIENIKFIVKDITTLTTVDVNKSNLVVCSSVIEYIDDAEKSVSVIDELLHENGTLIISFPNISSFYRKLEKLSFLLFKRPKYYKFVKNVYTADSASSLLAKHDFKVLETHYFSSAPIFSKLMPGQSFEKYTKNLFVLVATKNSRQENINTQIK